MYLFGGVTFGSVVYKKQCSDSLPIKSFSKKIKFFTKRKKKKKKIQRFDSWVAFTNSFHIPTLKKPLKKKKKIKYFPLSLSPYAPLSLSLSLTLFWNVFPMHNFETISLYLVEKLRKMASLQMTPNFQVQFLQMTPPALNLSTQDTPNASDHISLVRSPWILNFCCCYPNLFANE